MQTNARNQRSATGYILERILEVRVCGVDGLKSLTSQHVFLFVWSRELLNILKCVI